MIYSPVDLSGIAEGITHHDILEDDSVFLKFDVVID